MGLHSMPVHDGGRINMAFRILLARKVAGEGVLASTRDPIGILALSREVPVEVAVTAYMWFRCLKIGI